MRQSKVSFILCLIYISEFHETIFSWNILKSNSVSVVISITFPRVCVCIGVYVRVMLLLPALVQVKDFFTFDGS